LAIPSSASSKYILSLIVIFFLQEVRPIKITAKNRNVFVAINKGDLKGALIGHKDTPFCVIFRG
jgi:hypothetical protein